MPLRPQVRAYFFSVVYAALIFIPLHEPGLLAVALLKLSICASLLALLLLFVSYHKETRELVLSVFRACANLLLCLLPALNPDWLPEISPAPPADPFRAALFQRPPPRIA